MLDQRGQASVLMAFIFQIVFVFFAMVINVGMLVNDKINLQNSVDIAAYYAATKQAEYLNAIAHTNYQLRQAWKLLAYRLWIVGEAGRNGDIFSMNPTLAGSEEKVDFSSISGYFNKAPGVCVRNGFWREPVLENAKVGAESLCRIKTNKLPAFKPVKLYPIEQIPFTSIFSQTFLRLDRINQRKYENDCKTGALDSYIYATRILASYKEMIRPRLYAIQQLQRELMKDGGGFRDIDGKNIKKSVGNLITKNLTVTNKRNMNFIFFNGSATTSSGGSGGGVAQPFLNPIEVRAIIRYLDMIPDGTACSYEMKPISEKPAEDNGNSGLGNIPLMLSASDVGMGPPLNSTTFDQVNFLDASVYPHTIVGFEKNPWVVLYSYVQARTTSRTLFAPTDGIPLVAEAYAVPFGGKIGPWYYNQWPRGSNRSVGSEDQKVDGALPKLRETAPPDLPKSLADDDKFLNVTPNYARYPGDKLGFLSGTGRSALMVLLKSGSAASPDQLLKMRAVNTGETDFDYDQRIHSPTQKDGLAYRTSGNSPARNAELVAIAPNLFDATYYSIDLNFRQDFYDRLQQFGGLGEDYGRLDLGYKNSPSFQNYGVTQQITQASQFNQQGQAYWILKEPDHVNTSWAQETNDEYLDPSGGSAKIATSSVSKGNSGQGGGGRSGFSVKIVSEKFLRSELPLGGPGSAPGRAINAPSVSQ